MAEKVRNSLYISIADILTSNLFNVTTHENFYEVKPLFNFDSVVSDNPKDHTQNHKTLILQKIPTTMLSFTNNQPIIDYSEFVSEQTIDNIHYTLYYTYDSQTMEPAPYKKTSNGNTTDKNGYYLDSEIIEGENDDS
jgi:hypothetical protein